MPLEIGVWRIDSELTQVEVGTLDQESRLEDILDANIRVANPNWLVIGRQVHTTFGGIIDLLAIDKDGHLIVLELKKDRTPRDVVAQLLDYASWVIHLVDTDIARIHGLYLDRFHPKKNSESLDARFKMQFDVAAMPESLNKNHELVVVASELDASTERMVTYLSDEYDVPINAVFFRVYKDGEREYLTRAWFIDPTVPKAKSADVDADIVWNGEYYVSFGDEHRRHWSDAVKYGFISAGGGRWYSKTLEMLEPGDRVWVNVPGRGYVGVGRVTSKAARINDFRVTDSEGGKKPLSEAEVSQPNMFESRDDEDRSEYMVGVEWEKTVSLDEAIREKGFFGNQNTVCRPTTKSWQHTVERLSRQFGVGAVTQ